MGGSCACKPKGAERSMAGSVHPLGYADLWPVPVALLWAPSARVSGVGVLVMAFVSMCSQSPHFISFGRTGAPFFSPRSQMKLA